jgi:hypothetical protein
LDGPLAKVGRAIDHYRTIKGELHWGVDRKLRPVTIESDSDGLEYRFRVEEIEPLDPAWPLLLGDAYHNLRSAMDHLAFQLHVRHFRGKVPLAATKDSAFPIWDTVPSSPIEQYRGIWRLGKPERRAIEWLQPYKGWDSSYPPSAQIGQLRRALADVNMLDIIDKHREIHLVNAVVQAVPQPVFAPEFGFQQKPERKHGHVLVTHPRESTVV